MDWKEEIKNLIESGHCSDSDIVDYIEAHPEIHGKQVWNYVSDLSAPDACKGCEHVQLIGFSTPCTHCIRPTDYKDYYKKREDV